LASFETDAALLVAAAASDADDAAAGLPAPAAAWEWMP
jgi:hypothetical protein